MDNIAVDVTKLPPDHPVLKTIKNALAFNYCNHGDFDKLLDYSGCKISRDIIFGLNQENYEKAYKFIVDNPTHSLSQNIYDANFQLLTP